MTFGMMFKRMRRSLGRREAMAAWVRAAPDHPGLAEFGSLEDVLVLLGEPVATSLARREKLTRLALGLYRATRDTLWSTLLLVAFYPMLSRIRRGTYDERDDQPEVNQLAIAAFLEAIATVDPTAPPDECAQALRRLTLAGLSARLRSDRWWRRRTQELTTAVETDLAERAEPDDDDDAETDRNPHEVAAFARRAGPRWLRNKDVELLLEPLNEPGSIRSRVFEAHPDRAEAERAYQRVKKRRSRALGKLRVLFVPPAVQPIDEEETCNAE